MVEVTPGISWGALVLVVPALLLGLVLVWVVLRFLQRRLRIFTRGTVTFMVVACLVFTLFDLFVFAHEIKKEEQRVRRASEFRLAENFARSVLSPGEPALVDLDTPELAQDYDAVVADLDRQLAEVVGREASLKDCELVCLKMLGNGGYIPAWVTNRRARLSRSYGFSGILALGDELRAVNGKVYTYLDDEDVPRTASIDAEILDGSVHFSTASTIFAGSQYQNPRWELGNRGPRRIR